MRERDAGVRRRAKGRRHARHDLEADALLVQEHRFLGAAVEDEGIAPLEPRHLMAVSRLFGEQHRDGVLRDVALGGTAGVNPLRVRRRPAQHRFCRAVVDDDVGLSEQSRATGRKQSRIARPGADDDHAAGRVHFASFGPK